MAKLNGSDPDKHIGPSIILKVMAGDTIQAAVRAFYRQRVSEKNNTGLPAEQMLAGLLQAFSAPAERAASMHSGSLASDIRASQPGLTAADFRQLQDDNPAENKDDKSKAYLNDVFFDNQLKFVSDGSGVRQVDGEPNQLETLASGKAVAKKTGYVYVYTSNESNQDLLFDNMSVTEATGPILEEDHYYPYGLVMTGISTVEPLKLANNYKYNGKGLNHGEFSDGTGLDWYSYGMREYDPQIARFPQLDPLTDEFAALTPFQYASNEPIGNIDLDGLEAASILKVYKEAGEYVVVAAKPVTTSSQILKGLNIIGNIHSLASAALHGAILGEKVINGSSLTQMAGQALDDLGNAFPDIRAVQWYVGGMKEGVDMLGSLNGLGTVTNYVKDKVSLAKQGVKQLQRGDLGGGGLSILESTMPGVRMVVGETNLVKSAIRGNGQAQGRVAMQAIIFYVSWEAMASNPEALGGEMGAGEGELRYLGQLMQQNQL